MRIILALFAIPLVLIASLGLVGCEMAPSALEEADALMEQGDYRKAKEKYLELEPSEEINEKISECRFWQFANYVRDCGGLDKVDTTPDGDIIRKTYSLDVDNTGLVLVMYREESLTARDSLTGTTFEINLSIPHDSNEVKASASYDMTMMSVGRVKQTASGTFNKDTYKKGDSINWEDTTDTARTYSSYATTSLGLDVLKYNSSLVDGALSYLAYGVRTGTGGDGSLADIGFNSYK